MQRFQRLAMGLSEIFHTGADRGQALGSIVHRKGENGAGTIAVHQMPEFVALGSQIVGVVITGIHHQGNPFFHLKSIAPEPSDLAGVVGQQSQAMDA